MISLHFQAVPLALPGLLISAVIAAVASRWLARRLGTTRLPAALLIFGATGPLFVTLTPTSAALGPMGLTGGGRHCALGLGTLAPAHLELRDALNAAMFVPLGLAVGLLWRQRSRVRLLPAALLPAAAILAAQFLLMPWFGRTCQLADTITNTTGVVVGLAVAAMLRPLIRRPSAATEHSGHGTR
ncbi:hypothetical protein ER308_08935 [Egibacter rhizosphaerae]|uniref:VanZ-like domain-containing protein n=1 Tax=Egibacter rhizosphaerae TaxID=1670831 RepID=A0A411YEN9_9ACTN|nr:VanZ family protein [Egibacter rhizosphaerae]QBI19661.1 hypothetical protein ER308_08935 [Egibacter rhizosphaerae]